MTRVPESAHYGWFTRLMFWVVRRKLGRVPTPWRVVGLHQRIAYGVATMFGVQEAAKSLEPGLKSLARIQVARLVGCPF